MSNKEREDTSNNNSFSINHTLLFWCIIIFIVIVVAVYLGFNQIEDLRYHIMKVEMVAKNSLSNNQAGIPNMSENNLRAEIYSAAHEASESFVNHTGNLLTIFGIMLTIITAIICVLFPFLINKEQKEWMKQRLEKSEQDLEEQKKTIETIKTDLGNEIIREKEQREKYHYFLKSTNRFTVNMRRNIIKTAEDILPLIEHDKEYKELESINDSPGKIAALNNIIGQGHANSKIYHELGKLYSKKSNTYNKACDAFQNAVNLNNEFVDAYIEWAKVLENQCNLIESWEKREKAIFYIMSKDKSKSTELQDLQNEQNEIEKKLFSSPINSESKKTIIVEKVYFKMILVNGGTFKIGEEPKQGDQDYHNHKVLLNDYYIGETVVTQQLWQAIMGDNPSKKHGIKLPVENVSWENANKFIENLNAHPEIKNKGIKFRLPTNAEWEYAARGGYNQDTHPYSGNDNIDMVAWYGENSKLMTHPVMEKEPNLLGLYDMSGNVYEWCQDYWWGYTYHDDDDWVNPCYDKQKDDYGLGRICRGGGWGSSKESCRVTNVVNGHQSGAIGFRLVCTLT